MSMSDHDLLRQYAHDGSQAAFATLVDRHVNLVYSAARRQVNSPQLAEEVAQSVFIDLARHAPRFNPATPLVAWLHVVARRTAIDIIRREARRQAREHHAATSAACAEPVAPAMKPSLPAWAAVEPLLDEAVESLDTTDRAAILLRYFENKTLREVGVALGASEDAAQKRVSRSVEQLRAFFLRRGVTVTAAGLASDLSAHALQFAPAGLSATISAATALSTAASTATLETARFITMTTLQKSVVLAAFAVIGGAGLFQAAVYVRQDSSLSQLQAQSTALQREVSAARASHEALTRRLTEVETQIDARLAQARRSTSPTDPNLEGTLATWIARANRRQAFIATRPDLAIPELRLLSNDNWAEIASKSPPGVDAGSDVALREALALARKTAEDLFAPQVQRALNAFLRSSGGFLPDSLYQLLPYFESPISPVLLSRYHLLQTGKLDALPVMDQINWLIETREVVDVDQDYIVSVGTAGRASHSAKGFDPSHRGARASKP